MGRRYRCLGGANFFIGFNSPVEVQELRKRVRDIWKSDDPAKRLFDSLLLDYVTESAFDDLNTASGFQVGAAWRLLYYFPKESAPLIAGRLQKMDVKSVGENEKWYHRDERNGVRTLDFIRSVAWCKEPRIQEALADIAKRTDDKDIKEALNPIEK